ncbi:sensor histidine kinase KdpD [Fusibacter sp. 3D3]|uniref:sensor histidine kinase n=1 Tax=Fusibacter sp. 3D3 TaxID=1048380 RepID=UPI000855AFC6|nr:HAMP domain-containing sensor histidine kinase [Fusibacter sp. 3D3]GAU78290.1 sensor histidine kinase [Fusibacter sp. 3D3]
MRKFISRICKIYFGPTMELRVRLFHVLAFGGTAVSLVMGVLGATNGLVGNAVVNFLVAALSFALLTYSHRSGNYQLCYTITIVGIFLLLFPMLFFSSGGYHSGMPAFFVFAVAFTIFMLEGKRAIFLSLAEILLYIGICVVAYHYPESVHHFDTETQMLADVIIAFVVVSVVLGVSLYLHFRLYNEQQRKLDEQNVMLAQINRAKTEFLANTSHEMRTPLTVISVNIQAVSGILQSVDNSITDPEVTELLEDAQAEIMRLSRMVGGMLTLASISEGTEKGKTDFSTLLGGVADMLRLTLSKRGNKLKTEIEKKLTVFGNADLLSQVAVNLIQNAQAHTENGFISMSAIGDGRQITVTICDNGSGIPKELLPHVFERGVTDKLNGGTGFGLFLCKTVVESHGGAISIASDFGKGTKVSFTLPAYQGQYGGDGR